MNFDYNEDQQSIQDVAVRMFRDLCGDETIRNLYKSDQPMHTELWQQVAQSGLLGTALPSAVGGSEMGMTELCLILEQQGKAVAPLPILESVVEAAPHRALWLGRSKAKTAARRDQWRFDIDSGTPLPGPAKPHSVARHSPS